MGRKFPPKGYNSMEYPLPHNFNYSFALSPETATKNSTMIPLLRSNEALTAPDNIEVNPSHPQFAEETGSFIQPDSIVPKMNIHMDANMDKGLTEVDKIRFLKFNWMPVYFAFEDMYTAIDNKTDTEVEDIIPMIRTASTKQATPLYNNVKLLREEDWPMSTVNFTETFTLAGMNVDVKGEGITFVEETMWDALSFFSNSSMLSKAMGQWRSVILTHEHPWTFNSNNFTNPTVKRGNPFTFCGIIFHVPLVDSIDQYNHAGDITAATSAIDFKIKIRYDEWNNQFDQTAI